MQGRDPKVRLFVMDTDYQQENLLFIADWKASLALLVRCEFPHVLTTAKETMFNRVTDIESVQAMSKSTAAKQQLKCSPSFLLVRRWMAARA